MRSEWTRALPPLGDALRRVAGWPGWSRLRLPVAAACLAGGVVAVSLPIWSGWWTAHVQATKARAFHAQLAAAAPVAPSSGGAASPASVASPASAAPSSTAAAAPQPPTGASSSAAAAAGPRAVQAGDPLAELLIPSIGVDSLVLEGLTYDPAVWSQILREGPAHVQDSALPGHPGNSVIFGHLNIWGAVFLRLSELKPGDGIDMVTPWGRFHYAVTGSRTIDATDFAAVAVHKDGPSTLQLVTCEGTLEQHRLLVEAALVPQAGGSG